MVTNGTILGKREVLLSLGPGGIANCSETVRRRVSVLGASYRLRRLWRRRRRAARWAAKRSFCAFDRKNRRSFSSRSMPECWTDALKRLTRLSGDSPSRGVT